jgi:aryl-alcohol dehydrogenase-like predicted oxidoreductase
MNMTMRVRLLGRSGIRVSELCLGTMTFGTDWEAGADETACREIYSAFREAGGNFVDTANVYTRGSSEKILGRLIANERDSVVVATKCGLPADDSDQNSAGTHRKSLRRNVETSLRRLSMDYIDVLWVHAWDGCTAVEETMRALDDLVRTGKVLAIGVSNTPAWTVARAQTMAELRGWSSFCAAQVGYSLASRTAEREILPMARALGLAVAAWSPLAAGLLTGKFSGVSGTVPDSARRGYGVDITPDQQRAIDAVVEVAAETGATPTRIAIAWLLHHGTIPVLGARTSAQLQENMTATEVRLDDVHLKQLDAATKIELGYPYFLTERYPSLLPSCYEDSSPAQIVASSYANH